MEKLFYRYASVFLFFMIPNFPFLQKFSIDNLFFKYLFNFISGKVELFQNEFNIMGI